MGLFQGKQDDFSLCLSQYKQNEFYLGLSQYKRDDYRWTSPSIL